MISICFEAPNTTELNALIAAHLDSYAGTPQAPVAVPAPEETPKPKAKKVKAVEVASTAVDLASTAIEPEPAPVAVTAPAVPAPASPAVVSEIGPVVITAPPPVTLDQVKESLMSLAGVAGMPKVAEILGKFNARKISELVDANFHAVKSTADALVAELKKA